MQKITKWLVPMTLFLSLFAFLLIAPPGLLGKADAVGYAICHRISERSFHLGERQLPMCARDTGTFTSAAVTLLLLSLRKPKRGGMPVKKISAVLLLFFLIWAVDGSNSYLYLLKEKLGILPQLKNIYIPNNTLRLLTGTGMGMGMGAVLYAAFNQSVWKEPDMRPSLENWRDLGLLIAIMLLIDIAVLTEAPIVLYPIALISVLGVLVLLSLIFTVVWVMIMREENKFTSLQEMWISLSAGLTLTLLMLLAIDLFRFRLTGTWGAFPLG